ncbi:polysaccharide deacetylase family protein [Streptomyces lunaelactis]|uniref:polysaccharide deacetylase family protein n=1 Tax=Streptomyces lunaelactis TaxID=1535768 RepID=UPI00158468B9|nr:polysaccharide deacetylase family protein [Streptomyces lunaelactis]NUK06434.1 polysaccharide deacetylase family protein [Streptomyces lunaelactis]NUK36288.1 polysaccharide deacetylase family protein [Streptomyces lunaelactis]NUK42812.1 polysaccharide deacetylase family protein [Streptomyces lunaelactis]NUK52358.1 polysaccharide deacetylase family protein [Streptomyces lunaelactis]NUK59073.1 polysaccharide deacetylase family protein [Streptomyces lunaelactis]
MNAVPVFLYHSVTLDPPSWIAPLTVSPRTLADHLDRIVGSGLDVIPLRRLVAALHGGPPIPARSAVLTFDDGYADFYSTVAPLLADRGLPATLYITTGAMHAPGRPPDGSLFPPAPMLSWGQVEELDELGFEIGGHTRTHPQLDTLSGRPLRDEVAGCKDQLEDALGHPVSAFAYPHGYSSLAVCRMVREAGWTSAAAVSNAFSSPGDDPLRIARLMVHTDTGPELFRLWTEGAGAPVAPFPERVRTRGWRSYRRLRARLHRPYQALPAA